MKCVWVWQSREDARPSQLPGSDIRPGREGKAALFKASAESREHQAVL